MTDKTGGAAFPVSHGASSVPGATLRDYFAGQALMGLCSNSTVDMTHTDAADWCGERADAMLAERDK